MKAHILIVEDEAILYEKLRKKLVKENYSVSDYTPSVKEAIASINHKRPDIVLLDINLQGELTGLDLGKMLSEEYKIPFIYVTEREDNETFYEGLHTNHEDFVVKVNRKIDVEGLIRKIQTVLHRNKAKANKPIKDALLVYVDYIYNLTDLGNVDVSQIPLKFEDVAVITRNTTERDEDQSKQKGKEIYKKVDTNYALVVTWDDQKFYIRGNLASILNTLPHYFVRISEHSIVNIKDGILNGRINGKRLKIRDKVYQISERYKPELEKRFESLYQEYK
ncbi:CheY chemotaxis protein or a CheY-like REC (receiver) domain [Lutibacter oricola]|uniref:CheY chemotaxis protein or a CheY-like REC (Receiver) domain n=1 Tax=Lutibacter oricola TaxID=762486 RepID=A0A1H3CL18_9FLAO|nr:response regulator [Lutibacter oricola]SDX54720.1 CheY chemotaxis protein or a CheY-like REC (receiver) domain [Lutibacter oricola]